MRQSVGGMNERIAKLTGCRNWCELYWLTWGIVGVTVTGVLIAKVGGDLGFAIFMLAYLGSMLWCVRKDGL